MNQNIETITYAVSIIFKAAIVAAKYAGRVRKRSLKRLAAMDIGEKDKENGTVTLRDRIEGDLGASSVPDAVAKLQQEIAAKTVRRVAEASNAGFTDRGSQNEY